MILIDAELTAKEIAKFQTFMLECGNDEMNKMMEGYNPSAFSVGFDYGMKLAQKVVGSQPTAYNVKSVVEQLEEASSLDDSPMYEPVSMVELETAIEIVKGGAV